MRHSVLGIGVAKIDYNCILREFPQPNTKVDAEQVDIQGGGNCMNTLVGLSRLGVNCSMISRIGTDSIGDEVMAILEQEGIGTEYMEQECDSTPFSFNLIDQKRNTRTGIRNDGDTFKNPLRIEPEAISGVDLIYIDGRFREGYLDIIKKAKESGKKIFVEAESEKFYKEALIRLADVVSTSQNFHLEHFGDEEYETNLKSLVKLGPKVALTTLGSKGSIIVTETQTIKIDAFPATIVDTTGAGDAYIAGFIYGLLNEWDLEKTGKFASKVAASKCAKIGAQSGLPHLNEIN